MQILICITLGYSVVMVFLTFYKALFTQHKMEAEIIYHLYKLCMFSMCILRMFLSGL